MVPWKPTGYDSYQFVPLSQRFYRERIVFLGDFLDEQKSNNLIATLLYLKQESDTELITLYFNQLKCPIMTVNLGLATGMAAFLCAAGTPGKRFALPNARFLLQKTGLDDPFQGQAVDIGLKVSDNIKDNKRVAAELAKLTGRTAETVAKDLERDFYLSSFEARDYGIIDKVLLPTKLDGQIAVGFGSFEGGNAATQYGTKGFAGGGVFGGAYGGEQGPPPGQQVPSRDDGPPPAMI